VIGDDRVIRYTRAYDVTGGPIEAYSQSVGYLGNFL